MSLNIASFFQAFDQYIAPTVVFADIVVPRGGENSVAIDLIIRHVRNQLEQVGENRFLLFLIDFFKSLTPLIFPNCLN